MPQTIDYNILFRAKSDRTGLTATVTSRSDGKFRVKLSDRSNDETLATTRVYDDIKQACAYAMKLVDEL